MPDEPLERISRDELESLGDSSLGETAEEMRDERREAIMELSEMYERRQGFLEAGVVEDAPAVEELDEHIAELEENLGFRVGPAAEERLVDEFDADSAALEHLASGERDELLEHLEAVDQIASGPKRAQESTLARKSLEEHRRAVERLASEAETSTTALAGRLADGDAERERALLTPADDVVDDGVSDRVARARLEDALEETDEALSSADGPLTEIKLLEKRERLVDELEAHGGAA